MSSSDLPPPSVPDLLAPPAAPAAALGPDELRALVRECVTVVKPGEVLVVRVSEGWTWSQVHDYQEFLDAWAIREAPGLKFLLMPAAAVQSVGAEALDAAADAAVERALTRQRHARGGNGRSRSGAGGATASASGGSGTAAGGGASGVPVSVRVTTDPQTGRLAFMPASGCCGGNCGCGDGSPQ